MDVGEGLIVGLIDGAFDGCFVGVMVGVEEEVPNGDTQNSWDCFSRNSPPSKILIPSKIPR